MHAHKKQWIFIGYTEEWPTKRIFTAEFLLKPRRRHWERVFGLLRLKWSFMTDLMKFNDTKYRTSSQHIVYSKNMLSVHLILSAEWEVGGFISIKCPEEVAKAWHKWFEWQCMRRTLCPDLHVWLTSVIFSGTAVSLFVSLIFTWKQF